MTYTFLMLNFASNKHTNTENSFGNIYLTGHPTNLDKFSLQTRKPCENRHTHTHTHEMDKNHYMPRWLRFGHFSYIIKTKKDVRHMFRDTTSKHVCCTRLCAIARRINREKADKMNEIMFVRIDCVVRDFSGC